MIIKLLKNPNSNSIEASWIEEKTITTSVIVEKEIDGELTRVKENKDIIVKTTIHCQSFSDTQIDLLRQTAKNFNTTFSKEQEALIKEVESNRVLLTQEELAKIELDNDIAEAKAYLASTDYKMTVDYFATLSKEIQDELVIKRAEARETVRLQK